MRGDDMEGAARMNSIEVRGRAGGKAALQRRLVEEARAQGIEVEVVGGPGTTPEQRRAQALRQQEGARKPESFVDEVLPAPSVESAVTRVIPAWQYRELAQIEGLDMSAFEADETQQEKPREQQRFYSNRAMRRAAAKTRQAKGGRRIF